jgi:hypothetical protein
MDKYFAHGFFQTYSPAQLSTVHLSHEVLPMRKIKNQASPFPERLGKNTSKTQLPTRLYGPAVSHWSAKVAKSTKLTIPS